ESGRAEALIVIGSRLISLHRRLVGDFAKKNRIILVGVPSWLMEAGALLTYGPNVAEIHRRAATYLDKILKSAQPPDLPLQQPTTVELNINLKGAQEVGLALRPTVT